MFTDSLFLFWPAILEVICFQQLVEVFVIVPQLPGRSLWGVRMQPLGLGCHVFQVVPPHFHEQGQSSLRIEERYEIEFTPRAVLRNEQTPVWAKKKILLPFPLQGCSSCIAIEEIGSQILWRFATKLFSLLYQFVPTFMLQRP